MQTEDYYLKANISFSIKNSLSVKREYLRAKEQNFSVSHTKWKCKIIMWGEKSEQAFFFPVLRNTVFELLDSETFKDQLYQSLSQEKSRCDYIFLWKELHQTVSNKNEVLCEKNWST